MKVILAFKKSMKPTDDKIVRAQAKAIQLWTNHEYFHVEMIIGNRWISSHTDKGVRVAPLGMLKDTWDYYEIDTLPLTPEQETLFWDFIKEQEGAGYDWKGVMLSQLFTIGINSDDKWFCSEIVTKLLQMLYVRLVLDLQPNKVSPAKLYLILKDILKPYKI